MFWVPRISVLWLILLNVLSTSYLCFVTNLTECFWVPRISVLWLILLNVFEYLVFVFSRVHNMLQERSHHAQAVADVYLISTQLIKLLSHDTNPFQVSAFLFFLAFDFCRFCVVICFFLSPPQQPNTSNFEGFSIPDFIHYIYFLILILSLMK